MPILNIRHLTTYRYHQPVAFGEHRMMLLPRDDGDQKVLQSALDITPRPRQIVWKRDHFGNHVAIAQFEERAAALRFESTIRLDHAPFEFRRHAIADHAARTPFQYSATDWRRLKRFILPLSLRPELTQWCGRFFGADGTADTFDLLVGMTQAIRRDFRHVARHERGIQAPPRTLALGAGSCRDLAVLMIEALRSRGIAARFVSGYLHLRDQDDDEEIELAGGNTHAWVQAYIPGPGWVDFDPSGGMVGNTNLIRVAVVPDPRDAIPLQGSWYGSASDHLAMQVAVRVKAVDSGTFTLVGS
jgi:transglutaminase-like putative cysteine protease